MSGALAAFGTFLKIGDGGGPETFTTIAEVTDLGGPKLKRDTIDVTNHSSSGKWREFLAGLKDGGTVSMKLNFIPTNATHSPTTGLLNDFDDGTLRNFKLYFTDAGPTIASFAAIVTSFEPAEPVDGALTADSELKVSGAVSWA